MKRSPRRPPAGEASRRFWGKPGGQVDAARPVRPSEEPTAVVRSLGPLPLGAGRDTAAVHYLEAIYAKAVSGAGALAAAAGLLQLPEDD